MLLKAAEVMLNYFTKSLSTLAETTIANCFIRSAAELQVYPKNKLCLASFQKPLSKMSDSTVSAITDIPWARFIVLLQCLSVT